MKKSFVTFSHEVGDGAIKNRLRDAGVVGHGVLLHHLERCELHNFVDGLIRERQVQVPHHALHFPTRVLWWGAAFFSNMSHALVICPAVYVTCARDLSDLFHVFIEEVEDILLVFLPPETFHMVVPGSPRHYRDRI